jgi:hypothetical protein
MHFVARLRELSAASRSASSSASATPGSGSRSQGHGGDRHHARLHRRRRRRGRHRRRAAGVHQPRRHAAAGRPAAGAQHLDGSEPARPRQDRLRRQGHLGLRHRARHGAGRRLVQRCARLHVRARLHAGADLPHRALPDRRHHPGPAAPARAGPRRQGRARLALPRKHPARAQGAGRGRRPAAPQRNQRQPHRAARQPPGGAPAGHHPALHGAGLPG